MDRFWPKTGPKRPKKEKIRPRTPPKTSFRPDLALFGQIGPKTGPKLPKEGVLPLFWPFWTVLAVLDPFWTRFDPFWTRFDRFGGGPGTKTPLIGALPPTNFSRFFDLLYLYKTLVIAFLVVTPLTPPPPPPGSKSDKSIVDARRSTMVFDSDCALTFYITGSTSLLIIVEHMM